MNPFIEIGNRRIGYDYDPLVIAEIGINHSGDIDVAIAMADAAIDAGAEAIKHQTHIIEDEMSHHAKQVIPGNADRSIYEIMAECALSKEDELLLKEHTQKRGCIFLSTPFSRAAANRLEAMEVLAYKIGSGECNNYPLIEHIARFRKPIILSTGMNDINSVGIAVDILRQYEVPYCLLHCTNLYPTPDHLIRLGGVTELQQAFPDAVVGLSDHSADSTACLGALALGASVLERHFTDKRDRPGPDIQCSMDADELGYLIQQSKRLKAMRGGKKGLLPEEQVTADFAYASVVSIEDIEAGSTLSEQNIWVKRPGNGEFLAVQYKKLLGTKVKCNIPRDSQIKSEWLDL